MSFEDDMSVHDQEYAAAEAEAGNTIFTDGSHQAAIVVSRVEEGQYGWQFVIGFAGIDQNTGKPATARKWTNLPPKPEFLPRLKADLLTLGYDGPLSGLNEACISGQFLGLFCDIGVKRKMGETREYVNVYVNASHGKVEGAVPSAREFKANAQLAEDDIPF